MTFPRGRVSAWKTVVPLLVAGLLVLVPCWVGCGGSQAARRNVTGKVTFQGSPVEEGTVTFENTATGTTGSAQIGAGGQYSIQLPDGSYKVSVEPPLVETGGTSDTPGDMEYKPMENIPEKYRTTRSSPLSVEVSSSKTTHDLEMQP